MFLASFSAFKLLANICGAKSNPAPEKQTLPTRRQVEERVWACQHSVDLFIHSKHTQRNSKESLAAADVFQMAFQSLQNSANLTKA